MCLNHRLYRAEMAEIYFFNFLLFSGNKTGTFLLSHGTKKQRRREGISGNAHAVFRDFCILRCSKGFARGTHPHLPSLPRNCHCDCSTTVELGLMQTHREIFLKLGIMKVKVSLVTWNEKNYWWHRSTFSLQMFTFITEGFYSWQLVSCRLFIGNFLVLTYWVTDLLIKHTKKINLFRYGDRSILETKLNGWYSPHLEISGSFNRKYQTQQKVLKHLPL